MCEARFDLSSIAKPGTIAPTPAFWSDITVPVIGFVFLWLQYRYEREDGSAAPYPWLRHGPALAR
jgi:hypothetical protein